MNLRTEPARVRSVSAIIPVFNGEKYLGEALDSVFNQRYSPLEVVVVDDGSTDSTARIATSHPEVRYFYQENQGHASAKNTGLAKSTGELIAFLDADDLWVPDKLHSQALFLDAHPELGCVIGRMKNFLDPRAARPAWVSETMLAEDETAYSLGTLLAHRWLFDTVGCFDLTFAHGNDLDWFARLKEVGVPVAITPEILLLRRIHDSNLSQDQPALARERIRVLRAHLERIRRRAPASGME